MTRKRRYGGGHAPAYPDTTDAFQARVVAGLLRPSIVVVLVTSCAVLLLMTAKVSPVTRPQAILSRCDGN